MADMTAVVALRPAAAEDEAMLLEWANDPGTRAASRSHEPIPPADHRRWLGRLLAIPDDARIWIGESDGLPIGVVRFERRGPDRVEVSITVAPDARGRGLARPLLEAGIVGARAVFGGVQILADVLPGNDTSMRLFRAAGFQPMPMDLGATPGIIRLELR
jgi:RimJ/RimL family protein N-acetyltransferase